MKIHYLEYGGGLGDIFKQMFHNNSYNFLMDLDEENIANIITISHNPYIYELFYNHPKRHLFKLHSFPYFPIWEESEFRKLYSLPEQSKMYENPVGKSSSLSIFPFNRDLEYINKIDNEYIMIAPDAGQNERNFPKYLFESIIATLLANTNYKIIIVGRHFQRETKERYDYNFPHDRVINLYDKLTIPGTMALMLNAKGVITTHSALNILAWLINKPQILLYPDSVYFTHICRKDNWAFGIDNGMTYHSRFVAFSYSLIFDFINKLSETNQDNLFINNLKI